MSKRPRRRPIEPLASMNTLDNYFKSNSSNLKESAKPSYYLPKEQSIGNAQTNDSQRPASQPQSQHQDDDLRNQRANGFDIWDKLKNGQFEVESGNQCQSRTMPMTNLNRIKLEEEDCDTITQGYKASMNKAVIKQASKNIEQSSNTKARTKGQVPFRKIEENEQKKNQLDGKLKLRQNKKVEDILKKQPLRNRFSSLLCDDLKYSIGYQHTKLLKLLRSIDCTMEFLRINRQTQAKGHFFSQLRKMLYQNNRMEFSTKSLQQLLFIDSNLFQIQWANNEKLRKYDITITIPIIRSEDERIQQTRKKIVGFLLIKQAEHLVSKNLKKQVDKWSEGFDPNHYSIPAKDLPTHPNMKSAEIGQLSRAQIDAVPNHNLRNIMNSVKQRSEARSLCSNDVTSMIFENKSNAAIKDRLLGQILQKQQRMAVLAQAPVQIIDKKMALDICTEIQMIYMSKGVTNIFRETLLDSLNKRLRYKQVSILQCFQLIISQKQIQFLKEVTMASKAVVIVINKERFKVMRDKIESSM